MTTVWGTPDPTSVLFDNKSMEWDACVQSCFERANCAMVHQEKDSEFCSSYSYGDIWRVDKDTADKVSIKVTMDEDTCFDDPWTLFNSSLFDSFVTTSTFTFFRIFPTDQYYTFSYMSGKLSESCKDWLRPETDCNCPDTMISFYGYLTVPTNGPPREVTTSSWKECMFLCWTDPVCFLVTMTMSSETCAMFNNGNVTVLFGGPKGAEYLQNSNMMAVKLTVNSNTCNLGYLEVLKNHRYTSPSGFSFPSFQIRASPTVGIFGVNWIEENNAISNALPLGDVSSGFLMMYGHPGISYDESSVFCATLGDGLMPITSLSWLPLVYGYMAYSSKLSRDSDSDNDSVPYQFYVGLKKVNEVWTWSTPGGLTLAADSPDLMWADGYPLPDDECAWIVVTDADSYKGKTLQSANCSVEAKGLFCHFNLMEEGV